MDITNNDLDISSNSLSLNEEKPTTSVDGKDGNMETNTDNLNFNTDKAQETIDGQFKTRNSQNNIAKSLILFEDKAIEAIEGPDANGLSSTEDKPRDYFPVTNFDFDFGVF